MNIRDRYETLVGEQLKTAMELTLNLLGQSALGRLAIERYAFDLGSRVMDPRLGVSIAGIELENPLVTGAGWDKKGRAVFGLYHLGFAGTEVGTVPEFGQPGFMPRPRMWMVNEEHSVAINQLGFNAIGAEGVDFNLAKLVQVPGVLGINVGKNKELADEHSPTYHAKVVERFNDKADYFVFNPSSPNTPGLQESQKKEPMREHMQAIMEKAKKPVFVKFAPDLDYKDLDASVAVVIEEGGAGLVIANTTNNRKIKTKYGDRWDRDLGGLSGDDPEYRAMCTAMVRHAYEEYGDKLDIFGVGGVKDAQTALEKIANGASAVQIVTAIRPSLGKVAARTNKGLIEFLDKEGIGNIQELVGAGTARGSKASPEH